PHCSREGAPHRPRRRRSRPAQLAGAVPRRGRPDDGAADHGGVLRRERLRDPRRRELLHRLGAAARLPDRARAHRRARARRDPRRPDRGGARPAPAGEARVTAIAEDTAPRHRGFWVGALGRFARHPRSLAAACALVGLVLACALVPVLSPHDPYEVDFSQKQQGPSLEHPAGTDFFGRDLLERLALGGRTSLEIAAAALVLILLIGITYGALAATLGGRVDE